MKELKKVGHCANCGSENIEYGSSELDGEQMYYEFKCEDCGEDGKEWFNLVYDTTVYYG